jgi:[ribosomal protein S18]-alanine N-acetyltransferase
MKDIIMIRSMEEKDLKQVLEIEKSSFSRPWTHNDFLDSLKAPNIYMVAEVEDEIAGYCGLWGVAGEGQINNVAVAQKYRNKGIALAMLTQLICIGREQGLVEYTLEVRKSNLPAISVYHKLGFIDEGFRKNYYEEPAEDALIMWLKQQ